ncbi:MAG: transposase [Candidatus Jordarchaeales archaeon]
MSAHEISEVVSIYLESFRLGYAGYSYRELRQIHSEYNSQIDSNALYDAKTFRRIILKTHNYPKRLNPKPLLRQQDFRINGNEVSIVYKPRERLKLKVFPSEKQIVLMNEANQKGARIVERDGKYFLNLVLEKDVVLPDWRECETVIGVDIGINYIAVCSALTKDGKFTNPLFFRGGEWKHLCDRKRKITCSKEFKHLTRRQHEILHTVSKHIVEYAKSFPKPIIVMEKLGNFKNNSWNKRWNFLLGNWARRKLQQMIEYKAKWEGIPVAYINPAYTSLYCHYCGSKGKRNGIVFKCSNCSREYNADANAAMNLAKRFRQLLDEPKAMIGERSQADMRSAWEGNTYLPRQTHIQPENGKEMNRMRVTRTVTLPLGVGGG